MSTIEPYAQVGLSRGVSRQVGRGLTRIQANTSIDVARVQARADIQTAQIDAMTGVTQRGLQGAAYITSVEMTLAEATPAAMTRLKQIGDMGTMALSQIVMDTATKLRRI
jgi:hypothetical protein